MSKILHHPQPPEPARSRPTADLMHSMLANETYDEQDFYTPLKVANESMLHNDFRPRPPNPPNHGNRNPWSAPPQPSPRQGQPRFHNPAMSLASKQGRDQLKSYVKESFNQPRDLNQTPSIDDPNSPLHVHPPNHAPHASAQQA